MKENTDEKNMSLNVAFSLERHSYEEHLREKKAYESGCDQFDKKYSQIPSQLFLNIRHEAGLAEVAKSRKELLKYSIHLYRQVEIVFNAIFGSQNSTVFRYDTEFLTKLYKFIKWSDCIQKEITVFSKIDGLVIKPSKDNRGKNLTFNKNKKISKIDYRRRNIKFLTFKIINKGLYGCSNNPELLRFEISDNIHSKKYVEGVKIQLKKLIDDQKGNLEFSQREFLFKNAFYFDGEPSILRDHSIDLNQKNKVYLNALIAIKYFRNIGSHNNYDNQTLEQKKRTLHIDHSEKEYWDNPETILNSSYFQQYIDMVLYTYAKYLESPHF